MKIILSLITLLGMSAAHASLQVYPTRIVLGPNQKSAQISLRYKGDGEETYRISTQYYAMQPDGAMTVKKKPSKADRSAHKMIRFSPKKVKLKKNVEQVVRVLLRRPKGDDGEYRTHIYFRPSDKVNNNKESTGNLAFNLQAKVAVAVPIIVKKGKVDTKAALSDLSVLKLDGEPHFRATVSKTGNGFVFGNLRLHKVSGTKKTLISKVNGISSYINKRTVTYPIDEMKKPLKKSDKLELTLVDPDSGEILASVTK